VLCLTLEFTSQHHLYLTIYQPWKGAGVQSILLSTKEFLVHLGTTLRVQQSAKGDSVCMDKLSLLLEKRNIWPGLIMGLSRNVLQTAFMLRK
jgi:hypothetical protein